MYSHDSKSQRCIHPMPVRSRVGSLYPGSRGTASCAEITPSASLFAVLSSTSSGESSSSSSSSSGRNHSGRNSAGGRLIKSGSNSYRQSDELGKTTPLSTIPRCTARPSTGIWSVPNALDTEHQLDPQRSPHLHHSRGEIPSLHDPQRTYHATRLMDPQAVLAIQLQQIEQFERGIHGSMSRSG